MTLYTEEVKRIIHSYDWPPGGRLKMEIQDAVHEEVFPYLIIRLFRDNFSSFDGVEQLKIAKIMNDLIPRLNTSGVPTRLEVAAGDGRIAR